MDSMITEKHIPIVTAPNDQLRCGVRSLQHESIQRHPVEIQQVRVSIDSSEVQISMKSRSTRISFLSVIISTLLFILQADKEWNSKLDSVRRIHGSALAMRLAGERQMFSEAHRIPGLKSSKIALETLMGEDSTIQFSDFLNDPNMRPDKSRVPLHDQLEAKLNM